jgi:ABC-type dipeptide/oligopeptide/nickel transport system permease component
MIKYAVRRIAMLIPIVFGALSLLFVIFYLLPGDKIAVLSGAGGKRLPEAVRKNIAHRYGLDQPIWRQYLNYFGRLAHFNLGDSYIENRPVTETIGKNFVQSIRLAIWAILIEIVSGIGLGVFSARKKGGIGDKIVLVLTVIVGAIPVFVMGFFLFQAFGIWPYTQGWPTWARFQLGIGPNKWFLGFIPVGSQWRYLVLPAFTLAGVTTAVNIRLMRASMLEVAGAEYIRTARSKGLSRNRTIYKHALRNAILPMVTSLGLDFGVMLGGAILTETVYNWPGIGYSAAAALDRRDGPKVMGIAIVVLLTYQVLSLLVDLSYGVIDPRIRLDRKAA